MATVLRIDLLLLSIVVVQCLSSLFSQAQFSGGDAKHWCCKVDADTAKPLLRSTAVIHYEKQTISVRTGYQGCGTWGTGRCSIYSARYKAVQKYGISYRQTAMFRDCPTKNLICCNQHSLVAGQCIHHDTLNKHVSDIEFLHNLGVLENGK